MFCPFTKESCRSDCALYVSNLNRTYSPCAIADGFKKIQSQLNQKNNFNEPNR